MPHALIIEDDEDSRSALTVLMQREGFTTSDTATLEGARADIAARTPDLVLLDLRLPDGNGIDLLDELRESGPQVVLITGHASVDTAVQALRSGAADYLTKPFDVDRLRSVLINVVRTSELRDRVNLLLRELKRHGRFGQMVGSSEAMQKVYDLVARVAVTDATVFITGESGTGKELVAQTVHDLSRRNRGPFYALNCGAVTPDLIGSELFGHEKGSFTGAERMHKGCFESASGGTLFLDEITEMPVELQVKLLRVLETQTITRIGGEQPISTDVRVVAATNRAPEEAVRDGKLREDLLYRLRVFPVHVPALRDRGDDVLQLAEDFLSTLNRSEGTHKKFTHAAVAALRAHPWPGNVRQLKNAVHQAYILSDVEIGRDLLPDGSESNELATVGGGPSLRLSVGTSVADAERQLILATLGQCGGDKKRAAEILQISLKTLYNRLRQYGERHEP